MPSFWVHIQMPRRGAASFACALCDFVYLMNIATQISSSHSNEPLRLVQQERKKKNTAERMDDFLTCLLGWLTCKPSHRVAQEEEEASELDRIQIELLEILSQNLIKSTEGVPLNTLQHPLNRRLTPPCTERDAQKRSS